MIWSRNRKERVPIRSLNVQAIKFNSGRAEPTFCISTRVAVIAVQYYAEILSCDTIKSQSRLNISAGDLKVPIRAKSRTACRVIAGCNISIGQFRQLRNCTLAYCTCRKIAAIDQNVTLLDYSGADTLQCQFLFWG